MKMQKQFIEKLSLKVKKSGNWVKKTYFVSTTEFEQNPWLRPLGVTVTLMIIVTQHKKQNKIHVNILWSSLKYQKYRKTLNLISQ